MKKSIKQSTLTNILNGCSIMLAIAVAALFYLSITINTKVDTTNKNRFELMNSANQFKNASGYLTDEVRAFAATGDKKFYDNYWNEVNVLKNRDIGVENMNAIGITQQEEKLISEMAAISNKLVPLEAQSMELAEKEKWDEALNLVYGKEYQQELEKINQKMGELFAMLNQRSSEEVQGYLQTSSMLQGATLAAIILIVIFQGISLVMVRQKIIRPIVKIKDEMKEFAKGNLHSGFNLQPDTSEIGQLVDAILESKKELSEYIDEIDAAMKELASGNFDIELNKQYLGDFIGIEKSIRQFMAVMSNTLAQINQASLQVAAGSGQVSDSAQALAQGATEQASSIQELSASLASVSSQIQQNTENSQKAADMSIGASGLVDKCNQEMAQLMDAMKEIEGKSAQIQHIINTIDDIAFQTNILALNAAVEAAGAGQAGKGFAVVADEVRDLASKSADAAKDTAEQIAQTVAAIGRGTKLAQNVATELSSIVEGARETTDLVKEVNIASKSQTDAILQINTGVEQISQVITSNSATSEESAAASEELSGLAEMMQQQVSRFKLKQGYLTLGE